MTRALRTGWMSVGLLVAATTASCTDAFIEPTRTESTQVDNRLELRGRVCTSPPNADSFPVKVVLLVDQSGSMCVSDPPGPQGAQGLCEQALDPSIVPPGTTTPARVRAVQDLVNQFRAQNGAGANVQVVIAPFHTNVAQVWPQATETFQTPDGSIDRFISDLQSQLGKGTDYQGAVSYATRLITDDVTKTKASNPAELPRTRYVVVFLTDGTPYPRCAATDNLPTYAGPYTPEAGPWEDSPELGGPDGFCNLLGTQGNDAIDGFTAGTDRNQNYQIFTYVDRLMELKQTENVGDIRFHSVLLFNERAVQILGTTAEVIYGNYDGIPQTGYAAAAKNIASWTLKEMADRGRGIYQEFLDGNILEMSLGALDYTSLASPYVMKTLLVENVTSAPGEDGPLVDSDGDGLPDERDNAFTLGTDPYVADSDLDCFEDAFEILHASKGFDADNQKDGRGCDPTSPLTLDCACNDTESDGLSQFAENYLKTHNLLADSDADGITDGIEVRHGLNPVVRAAAGVDTDGDGVPDVDEIRAGSNPTRPDRAYYERYGHQYEIHAEKQADGSTCYDFTVSNLHLVTPPPRAGLQQGFNKFKLHFAEAPESGVASDYGSWRTACAWAQYDPPSVRVPAGPDLTVNDNNFSFTESKCVGIAP